MRYLRNCWYQAGWSEELEAGRLLTRTILEEPIVLWRNGDNSLAALVDRCPHRFAPLSAGSLSDGEIACGYHGLVFRGDGRCTRNPHGPVTCAMKITSFPVVERHGIIWLWMGDPEREDPGLIPDLSFIDETPPAARIYAYMPTTANYQIIVDNILDLSHLDYVHPETLGGMMTGAACDVQSGGDEILVEWRAHDAETPIGFKAMVPEGKCDVRIKVTWQAPGLIVLDNAVTATGKEPDHDDHRLTLHNMTPESQTKTHYFMCTTRRFAVDDAGVTEQLRTALMRAFVEEDKPMLEKQQARMGNAEFWSLKPILLKIDSGAVRVRRKLDALITAEAREPELDAVHGAV